MESNSAQKVKNKNSSVFLTAFSTWRELGLMAITLLLMGAITLRSPFFLNYSNCGLRPNVGNHYQRD
jgi:hypothetical protein